MYKPIIMSKKILNEIKSISNELKEIRKSMLLQMITEGVDDPGILKCVFLAGGPGSGKSYVANEIFGMTDEMKNQTFSASGLKIVNSDRAFEKVLKDYGIDPKDLAKIEKDEPEFWNNIVLGQLRTKAKTITNTQKSFYEMGRLGMIIDGTGDEVSSILEKKVKAEKMGYDCYMIFVNTSLEVALYRNAHRSRQLSEKLVKEIWHKCQNNLGKFQHIFGPRFTIVDNTSGVPFHWTDTDTKGREYEMDTAVARGVLAAVNKFVNAPLQNPDGKKWVLSARALKNANLINK